MASTPNIYGPQALEGPFIDSLNKPAHQSQQQFSGYGGKLGTAAGLVSKFLAGAAEGRMRQAQKIENDKALKFSAIARYAQQIENDQTLTPEARSQKSQTILKLLGEQVLSNHGGDGKDGKKGDQKDGHPILGMIKHVAEGFVGGPLPKKYEGPSSDDLLKLIDTKPEDKIDFHVKKTESDLGQIAKDGKLDLNDPNVRTLLDRNAQLNNGKLTSGAQALYDASKQAQTEATRLDTYRKEQDISREGVSKGVEQGITDKETALGRKLTEDEKKQVLGMGGGLSHYGPTMMGANLPAGQKDVAGQAIDPTKSYKEQTDSKGNHVGYVAVKVGSQAPKIESLAIGADGKPTANPHRWKIYPDDTPQKPHREYLGPVAVGAVYRENDVGQTVAMPKYVPPRGSAAAPGAPSASSSGSGTSRTPVPPGSSAIPRPPVPAGKTATDPEAVKTPRSKQVIEAEKSLVEDPGMRVSAWDWITEDKLPPGSGKRAAHMKDVTKTAAGLILNDLGIDPSELSVYRSELKANRGALVKLTNTKTQVGQLERTLQGLVDYGRKLNKEYDRTDVKFANRVKAAIKGEVSDPKVTNFVAQMLPIAQDWGKIMQGSIGAGGVSVHNAKEAQDKVNANLGQGAVEELFKLIENDMKIRRESIEGERQSLLGSIRGQFPKPPATAVPRGTEGRPGPPPTTSAPKKFDKAEDYLKHIGMHP